jgi:hypothetical protein
MMMFEHIRMKLKPIPETFVTLSIVLIFYKNDKKHI